ncbi:unnamed protein product [Heligmosomoides polygyrus]|uniref:HTH_Tnp_Tc3_1 domain-containing protein n=1 Tax=Heligmosomoides polygyrus TaxID=6339 RepID=A0A183GTE1_HELPZ|nr:unnamed protein product [Heligmosomoides polygyrus]
MSMVAAHPKRESIIGLHCAGFATKDIVKALSVLRRTVQRGLRLFEESGGTSDRRRSGRPCSAVTKRNKDIIGKRIKRSPQQSIRKMANDLNISEGSVRTIVHKKLNLRSYRLQKCQALSLKNKRTRVHRCKEQAAFNQQNCRILSTDLQSANSGGRLVARKAHPATIMVCAFITSDGKSSLIFVGPGVKINQQNYLNDVRSIWFHGSNSTSGIGHMSSSRIMLLRSRRKLFRSGAAPT